MSRGISISGGGLRSAAFALGVLQALQSERGLLFGEEAAEYLTAVSGGSFTAASSILESARQSASTSTEVAPLAHGSPEERHILTHASYLQPDRWRFVVLAGLNLLSFLVLFLWLGCLLADVAVLASAGFRQLQLDTQVGDVAAAAAVVGSAVSVYILLYALYSQSRLRRSLVGLIGLVLAVICLPPALHFLAAAPVLQSRFESLLVIGALLVVIGIATRISYVAFQRGLEGPRALWLNRLAVWLPRALGFYLLAWVAVNWYGALRPVFEDQADDSALVPVGLAFFGTLIGGLLFSYVPQRVSLQREVRGRVASCFAIRRQGSTVELVGDCPLSELEPPRVGPRRYPQLLIVATANAAVRAADGRKAPLGSFVFSTDTSGIPEAANGTFATAKLELLRQPAGLLTRRQEPLISLMTAVACTGAAVSPAMGRATLPSARMVIAAIGIRLGRWMPNPMNDIVHRRVDQLVSAGTLKHDARMGPGYDELIPEMIGMTGEQVYVSDGGHYDNLGLLPLLRARCREIWCIDAPPEPRGETRELRRILPFAEDELDVRTTINLDVFAADSDGFYGATHAVGTLAYADGTEGTLHVIKLGLSRGTPADIASYRTADRGFPHHPTEQQVYSPARMDAYRRLGYDSASRAIRHSQ